MAITNEQLVEAIIELLNQGDELVQVDSFESPQHYLENPVVGSRIIMTPQVFRIVLGRVRHLCHQTKCGDTFTWIIPRE